MKERSGDRNGPKAPKALAKTSTWEKLQGQFNPRPPDDDEPQDWWFASTAIPLMAATTSPFANVMSVVALAMSWRSEIHPEEQDPEGNPVQVLLADPRWCIGLNATSLAFGVLGNLFLLFNFTRTIRYIIALPASIISWSLATAILIGITSSVHIYASPIPPNQTYSQAYWYAVIAAIHYFILTTILMINMLGYFLGHYPQHFALTDGQRTLILQTTAFGIWLIVGAAVFQKVIGISIAEALYFCDITILTLGFGDVTPKTPVGRGLVFPYAVIGIIILGLVVGSINKIIRDLQDTNVVQKHTERRREATIEHSLVEEDLQQRLRLTPNTSKIAYRPKHTRKTPIISKVTALYRDAIGRPKDIVMKEEKDRFDAMRAIQYESVVFRRWYRLILSLIAFGILWTCGAVVFWALEEQFTYFQALYFAFCSLLTIGYGDITPTTNAAKPFFVVWSLIAIPTMTSLISEMSNTVVAVFKHATSQVADYTVLPRTGKYKSFITRFPRILAYLEKREQNQRVTRGFQIGPGDVEGTQNGESSRNQQPIGKEGDKEPSDFELAQRLAFAIRRTTRDAVNGHPKRYSYEEWVEFTRMIRFTDPSPGETVLYEDEYGILNWDWMGENSPMLASQTEPEWVLDRLCESMIRFISTQAQKRRSSGDGDEDEPTLRKEKDI
ncbi:ion channel [Aspergillus bombycis]|uniref:Ion channel n=1 Tax=Aspergillus bombycis TaxID=109264 RepID=A0A1F8ABZ9_9EURO|nr:ion channel [Aspergillus bombycis]OGM49213.1 ion channel [Aspergillus bombycis]